MKLIKASKDDLYRLKDFYIYVIENTETMHDCCRWIYGQHPNLIHKYIVSGNMYFGERDGKIIAAIALTEAQSEDYHDAPWQKELSGDRVLRKKCFKVYAS